MLYTTSDDYITLLRNNGVKIKRNNNRYTEIPEDIIERTVKLCTELRADNIEYDLFNYLDEDHKTLKIWSTGYAE